MWRQVPETLAHSRPLRSDGRGYCSVSLCRTTGTAERGKGHQISPTQGFSSPPLAISPCRRQLQRPSQREPEGTARTTLLDEMLLPLTLFLSLIFSALHLVQAIVWTPFYPVSLPVAVKSPYLNVWLPQGNQTRSVQTSWPFYWPSVNTVNVRIFRLTY